MFVKFCESWFYYLFGCYVICYLCMRCGGRLLFFMFLLNIVRFFYCMLGFFFMVINFVKLKLSGVLVGIFKVLLSGGVYWWWGFWFIWFYLIWRIGCVVKF